MAAAIVAVVGLALTACAGSPTSQPQRALARGSAAGPFGPVAYKRARELLSQLVLPPGAKLLRVAPRGDGSLLHQPQATPGVRQLIAVHRIWRVHKTLSSTRSFVESRLPRGAHWAQRGSVGGPGTPLNELDAYNMPTSGRISVFYLDLAFVSLPHGWTGVRTDALVGRGRLHMH